MAELVPGAVLGAIFGELLKKAIDEVKKVKRFKSHIKDLKSTLERLYPLVKDIDSLHEKLGHRENELKVLRDTLKEAQKLAWECSKIGRFQYVDKRKYTNKIEEIDKALLQFVQFDLQLLLTREVFLIREVISLGEKSFKRLCSPPEPKTVTFGLEWPLRKLKDMLSEKGTSDIVVSAPGGCGKTTLVTNLCHDEEVKGKFKHIFYVTVSKAPNFILIVHNLFQHNGYAAPTFVSDEDATKSLQQLLKLIGQENSILLVLDDVWDGARSMLPKFKVQLPNYKILVTSRCQSLNFGSTYHLETLKYEDARDLLIEEAGQPNDVSRTEYEYLLKKILKRCDGYPLLIKVIGGSLKDRSLITWRSRVSGLSKGILETRDDHVRAQLQNSVDALDPKLKECFSDLGSFPEDEKIRASTIVDIWVELYNLDEEVHAMKFLEDLSFENLLTYFTIGNEHEDGCYNEHIVSQHDILRELSINQSELETVEERKRLNIEIQDDIFPDWCQNLRQPVNARLLSISTGESFSSTWVDKNFPMVEALVLNFLNRQYALPVFIAKMERLKVLTVLNRGFFPAKVSNLLCINSSSNLKRIRFEKVSITSLDIGQLQLRSLQKLSLVMCNLGEVFYDFEIDVSGALPSLQEIDIDYCNDLEELPYWISEVISLRKLSITNCNTLSQLPKAIGDLINLEALRLNSCIDLSELPETVGGLQKLFHLDISDCLSLKGLPPQIGKLQSLKKISMKKCSSCVLPESIQNLKDLQEVICDEDTASCWERFKPYLINLEVNVQKPKHNLNWLKVR